VKALNGSNAVIVSRGFLGLMISKGSVLGREVPKFPLERRLARQVAFFLNSRRGSRALSFLRCRLLGGEFFGKLLDVPGVLLRLFSKFVSG
jgi:hypothetical protein